MIVLAAQLVGVPLAGASSAAKPPAPTIDSAPPNPSYSASATFAFSDSALAVTFRCRLDGSSFSLCLSPKTYSGLADGKHAFSVKAVDALLNESDPTSYTWTVDTKSPLVTLDDKPPALTNQTTASFSFSSHKSGSTVHCSPAGLEHERVRGVQVLEHRGRLDLRVQARRRRHRAMHLSEGVRRSRGRQSHLPSAGGGRCRQRRLKSRGVLVADLRGRSLSSGHGSSGERPESHPERRLSRSQACLEPAPGRGFRPRPGVPRDEPQGPATDAGLHGSGEALRQQAVQERPVLSLRRPELRPRRERLAGEEGGRAAERPAPVAA